jgi:hypothetical protein
VCGRVFERSGDIFRFKIREIIEDAFPRSAGCHHIENIFYPNPKSSDTRASSTLLRVKRNSVKLGHRSVLPDNSERLHSLYARRGISERVNIRISSRDLEDIQDMSKSHAAEGALAFPPYRIEIRQAGVPDIRQGSYFFNLRLPFAYSESSHTTHLPSCTTYLVMRSMVFCP